MRKKISLLLCLLVSVLCFTACGGDSADINEKYDMDSIQTTTDAIFQFCVENITTDSTETVDYFKSMDDFALDEWVYQNGVPSDGDDFVTALESWQAGLEECGAYVSSEGPTYEDSNNGLKVMYDCKFENRDATLTFVYDEDNRLDSMTVDAKFSLGEILTKAGLNTILGMGTVFVVLIFISLIISCFKFIPDIQNAFSKKGKEQKAATPAQAPKKAPASAPAKAKANANATPEVDNSALIAVIAAAIAASEGTTTDGFVVRSIRRRPTNKW